MKKTTVTLSQIFQRLKSNACFDLTTDIGCQKQPKTMAKLFKQQIGFVPKPHLFHPVVIKWSKKGVGFGELCFWQDGDKIYCDNEGMSKEFICEILLKILSKTILTMPPKPIRKKKK
jgi:hypothetical protein